ncbi:MAG: UDP-2,3-diacylglucosamine diphosphatase [bacterium]
MRALWIADAHLSDPFSPVYVSLEALIDRLLPEMDSLIILGDLFEIWLGDNAILVAKHASLLDLLFKVRSQGKDIFYLKGNHDFIIGDILSKDIGAFIFEEEALFQWDGRRILASHGDQINKKDYGYQILKSVLRSSPMEKAIRGFGDHLSYGIAQKLAKIARGRPSKKKQRDLESFSLRYAIDKLQENDAVILGHSHVVKWQVFTKGDRRRIYLNPGSWSESRTYLWYNGGRFDLYQQGLAHPRQPKKIFDFDLSGD